MLAKQSEQLSLQEKLELETRLAEIQGKVLENEKRALAMVEELKALEGFDKESKRLQLLELEKKMADEQERLVKQVADANRQIDKLIEERSKMEQKKEWQKMWISEMVNNGHLSSTDNYSITLTHNSLKINGKKQDRGIAEKYIQLYERYSGQKLSSKDKVTMKRSSN